MWAERRALMSPECAGILLNTRYAEMSFVRCADEEEYARRQRVALGQVGDGRVCSGPNVAL